MSFLAFIAFCGFVLTLVVHLATLLFGTAILAISDRILLVVCWSGIGSFCLMLLMARSWSLVEFIANLFDNIPGAYISAIFLMLIYAVTIFFLPVWNAGTRVFPVWLPHDIVHRNIIRVMSSFIMLLYFWSACYYWFERPQYGFLETWRAPADDLFADTPADVWGDGMIDLSRRRNQG